MKETDLAKIVIEYLKDAHWEIYQEVSIGTGGCRADIVAMQNNISWIIETKLSLSMKLLEQAFRQRYHAHYISIAIPYIHINRVAEIFMNDYGIGGLKLSGKTAECGIYEFCKPRLNRKLYPYSDIRKWVNERHKYYAEAGNNIGKYWTPFQETTDQIHKYVKKHPGCKLKEMIDNINHHYHSSSSAKSSIAHWVRKGIIKNIKTKKNGKYIELFYEDA